jgi:uncharacterized membrane protein
VFNATFNNISVISWWSVLLVEETRGPGENHDLSQVTDKLYHIITRTFSKHETLILYTFQEPPLNKYLLLCGLVYASCLMVFNATFNNILVISWRSVLLVEETRGPGENHDLSQVTDKLYHIMSRRKPLTSRKFYQINVV